MGVSVGGELNWILREKGFIDDWEGINYRGY